MIKFQKLAAALSMPILVGILGSFFTSPAIGGWYAALNKPSFTPPSWVFPIAWTLLYLLMGISLYILWEKKNTKAATHLFVLQLVLNLLWSILFFGLKMPTIALIELLALLATVLMTTKKFYEISKTAAYLMVPYILWLCFATLLNYYIVILN